MTVWTAGSDEKLNAILRELDWLIIIGKSNGEYIDGAREKRLQVIAELKRREVKRKAKQRTLFPLSALDYSTFHTV